MKRFLFIFICFASTFALRAQWTFQVLSFTNNCMGWDWLNAEHEGQEIMSTYNNIQYSNRIACEAARNSIRTSYICLTIQCGPCTGKDNDNISSDPSANSTFAGPLQGVAFSPSNAADEIKQWVKDYYKQNGIDYDEAYLDELFENMYARKEFEQMYVQTHAQMMEMEDRESYLGESDSIKQRYLVTTKSGYIYEELNINLEERTVANPVSLDENGMPYLDPNAINPKQSLPDLDTNMDKPEPRTQPYNNYSTEISDESESNFGQSLADFLNENKFVYAVEQYILGELGEVIDKVTLSIAEGLATLVEMPAYPIVVAQNLMNAEVDFCQEGMDAILWAASHDITNENTRKAFERKYKKATVNFGFNLTDSGGGILKAANSLYNVRYGKD